MLIGEERLAGQNTVAQAKQQLRRLNIKALKGLGQHFLVDRSVLETITSAAELDPADTVVEVGPGLGILTEELVSRAGNVIAVEVDAKLAASLKQKFARVLQFTVLNADILDLDPSELAGRQTPDSSHLQVYKVVANLPYYIASAIMRHFLEASLKPALMVVMVQKEVAQSMVAEPGGMSLLSVSVQIYGKPLIVDYVPAQSFYPQPKVDSAIVRIDVYPEPAVNVASIAKFFEVVKAGFSTPRKQLRNSLSIGLHLASAETVSLLEKAGIDPKRRPQTLSLEEWAAVYRAFAGREE
ncbi:MAG TPA: ribosomal RNA small subunit methyltransferase A [Dehalococcoidia bacterium]|nr:ribosomal RNA small subunit methyltransferase A [Dehalococcoidia bacterium]